MPTLGIFYLFYQVLDSVVYVSQNSIFVSIHGVVFFWSLLHYFLTIILYFRSFSNVIKLSKMYIHCFALVPLNF